MNAEQGIYYALLIGFWLFTVMVSSYIIIEFQNFAGSLEGGLILLGVSLAALWAIFQKIFERDFDPSAPWE